MNKVFDFSKIIRLSITLQVCGLIILGTVVSSNGQAVTDKQFSIPESVRISPTTHQSLPVLERQFTMHEIKQGDLINVFQAPPCFEGNFYLGIQLQYDLRDQSAANLDGGLALSLLYNGVEQWVQPLIIDPSSGMIAATIFHEAPILCDKNYQIKINTKTFDQGIPEEDIYLRILLFQQSTNPFKPSEPLTIASTTTDDDVTVRWNYNANSAIEYDLEWVFVDSKDDFSGTATAAFGRQEPTRITTSSSYFKHATYYPDGKIFYRIRAVGYNAMFSEHRMQGHWFYSEPVECRNRSYNINWKQTNTFTGGCQYEKDVRFIDGLENERQIQKRIGTQDYVLIQDVLYDFEGRRVGEILPAPLTGAMRFQSGFNDFTANDSEVQRNTSPSQIKFHYDNGRRVNSELSTQTGSANYYSANNTETSINHNWLPDAEGFSYQQHAFSNSPLETIKLVGGHGKSLQLDGGHAKRLYTGTASQEEIIRLFGSHGSENSYRKELLIDENGQGHVTYRDKQNRTIATAVAGIVPDNLLISEKNSDNVELTVNISTPTDFIDGNRTSEYILLNTTPNTPYTFSYQITGTELLDQNFSIEIFITDPTGNRMDLSAVSGNESKNPETFIKQGITRGTDFSISVTLPTVGNFTITKNLVLPEIDYALQSGLILEQPAIQSSVAEIINTYKVDSAHCSVCNPVFNKLTAQHVIEESTTQILDNLYQTMIVDYKSTHNKNANGNIADSIHNHPLYCKYFLLDKNQRSDNFDKSLSLISTWEEALKIGLNNAIDKDPFFNDTTLSGSIVKTLFKDRLDSILIASLNDVDTLKYQGSLASIIDPENRKFYIDQQGMPDSKNGIHILYMDMASRRNLLTEEAYRLEVSKKRWLLYRAYYLEIKRTMKLSIPAYQQCPVVVAESLQIDELQKSILMPRGNEGNRVVGMAQAEMILTNLTWVCNKSFTPEETVQITDYVSAYLSSHSENFLNVILRSDIPTDTNLIAIQKILNRYGCGLDFIAQENSLVCHEEEFNDPYATTAVTPVTNSLNQTSSIGSSTARTTTTSTHTKASKTDNLIASSEPDTNKKQVTDWFGSISKSDKIPDQQEFQALVALYKKTNGDKWYENKGWKDGAASNRLQSVAGWYGVATNTAGHVIALKLEGNNLNGILPDEIGGLAYLEFLDIGSSKDERGQLSGSIPLSLGKLSNLNYLDLQNNKLAGPLPNHLFNIISLTTLNLSGNDFTGAISDEVAKLSKLIMLNLSGNRLSGRIPSDIGKLSALKQLHFFNNQFSEEIPASIGNLGQLQKLDLSNNKLTGNIPGTLGGLKRLQYLRLDNNRLTGGVPIEIAMIRELKQLDISYNALSRTLPDLSRLTMLQHLVLRNNQLTGEIPSWLARLPQIISITLANNNFSGALQSELFANSHLQYLDLSGNQIAGELPTSISAATGLKELLISENKLTGAIPATVGEMNHLVDLSLHHNDLNGAIPNNVERMISLTSLQLHHNSISGPIPSAMGSMTNLQVLLLGSNKLSDTIPADLGNLQRLVRLDLSNNQLVGPIPDALGNLQELEELTLNNNALSGQLPPSLQALKKLSRLIVLDNNLEGTISSSLPAANTDKHAIWLSNNKYTFSDLLPVKDEINAASYIYHRQDSVDSKRSVPAFLGEDMILSARVDRGANPPCTYQWFKYVDGVKDSVINQASVQGHTVTIHGIDAFDQGAQYYYKITHPVIPHIELVSNLHTVIILPPNALCMNFNPLTTFSIVNGYDEQLKNCLTQMEKERKLKETKAIEQLVSAEITKQYKNHKQLIEEALDERFTFKYIPTEHDFNLYQYDLAGNLVQTVLPKNVRVLNTSDISAVRSGNKIDAQHGAVNRHHYDALNHLILDESDHQTTFYKYDNKGHLRLTQNKRQENDKIFEYIKYDKQDRENERGEFITQESMDKVASKLSDENFPDRKLYTLSKVIRTVYDIESADTQLHQQNMRGNISSKEEIRQPGADPIRNYFSYDAAGNVKSMEQVVPTLEPKIVQYQYDLITNKPKFQFYQYNKSDEFTHSFSYTDAGRLAEVSTSTDGFIWNADATYQYYKHGALARVELGEYRVQGLDYYYTLHGWLKGVNMPYKNDPGKDGALVAKDAFAYTIGYYQNDYQSIGNMIGTDSRDKVWQVFHNTTNHYGVYTGQPSWLVSDVEQFDSIQHDRTKGLSGELYMYDQTEQISRKFDLTSFTEGSGFQSAQLNTGSLPANKLNSPIQDQTITDDNGRVLAWYRDQKLIGHAIYSDQELLGISGNVLAGTRTLGKRAYTLHNPSSTVCVVVTDHILYKNNTPAPDVLVIKNNPKENNYTNNKRVAETIGDGLSCFDQTQNSSKAVSTQEMKTGLSEIGLDSNEPLIRN